MQTQSIKISDLKSNTGQIKGLPKNPRILKDHKFEKLVKSIQDDPEMLELRELIVYDNNGEMVVICGNMRLKAMKELKYKEAPCKILPNDTDVEKLKAYTIKDNVAFGEHDYDLLANEWDVEQLEEWGLDVPNWSNGLDVNNMTDNDVDLEEEFDPIGNATDLHKVIFIFDNEIEAAKYFDEKIKDLNYKKFGGGQGKQWQVNLSKTYGK